jgi:hypothetical protein
MNIGSLCLRRACAARLWIGISIGAAALSAQSFTLDPLTTAGVQQHGFRVYNFSVYSGYSTVDSRWNSFLQSATGTTGGTLPSYTTATGLSGSVGLHLGGSEEASGFSVIYTPSYSNTWYGHSYGMWTHSLALNWAVKLAPRWQFAVSGSGVTGNFNQLLFSPTAAQSLASAAGTAADLSSAVLIGQSGSSNISAASAPSAMITPQQRLFYGDRMFSAILAAALSYSRSTRLTIGLSVIGNRMQHLQDLNGPTYQNAYLIPQTTNLTSALSIGYMMTPRTSITGQASYGRTVSALNEAQFASAQAGLGRKLTARWFAQFSAGAGYILPLGANSTGVHGTQWEGSGGLGYRGSSQTILASVRRSVSDLYGTGAAATVSSVVGWSWRRRGSPWALQASGGQDKLLGNQLVFNGLGNNGVRANAGVYWNPSRHTSVVLQYSYVTFSGIFPGVLQAPGQPFHFNQHSIRLNLGWGIGAGRMGQDDLANVAP